MGKTRTDNFSEITWYGPRMTLVRGIAIILVTLGHSEPVKTALPALKELIYSFHMPLFFFMSGFFSTRFRTEGFREYVFPRLSRLMIPYLVVSLSFMIIKWLVPSLVKRPVDPLSFFSDLFFYPLNNPALFLWFLYIIIVMKFLTAVFRFLPTVWMFVLSIVPAVFIDVQYDLLGLSHLSRYAVFFMAGLWLATYRERLFSLVTGRIPALLFTVTFVLFYFFHFCIFPPSQTMCMLVAFAGTFMVLSSGFTWFETLKKRGFLEFAGKNSLEIYLLQYYFIFPVYYLLMIKGVPPVWVIPFTFAAGLAGPALVIKYLLPHCRVVALLLGSRS